MILIRTSVKLVVALSLASSISFADAKSDLVAEGRKVFVSKKLGNCLACHSVQGDTTIPQTGNLGPKLANMDKYPASYLFDKIWDPNKTNPTTIMPPMGRGGKINKTQINAIIAYLQETAKTK